MKTIVYGMIISLPCLSQAMVNGYSPYREYGNQSEVYNALFKKGIEADNDEDGFKKAWIKLKAIQELSKKTGSSRFSNRIYAITEADMRYYEKRLVKERHDEIVKQLEEEQNKTGGSEQEIK